MIYQYYFATRNYDMQAILNSKLITDITYKEDIGPVYDADGKKILRYEKMEYCTVTSHVCLDHWFA